tara:strand:- start:736 stop:1659 length:924 start_codon:yes stop_codon:yes gene_type:complete
MNITESKTYSIEDDMSVIKITGKDATSFLQGQFSNDIKELDGTNYQISSYSTNQGKVIGIFRILKIDADFIIIISTQIAYKLVEKLNMYKLASDVTVTLDENLSIYSTMSERSGVSNDEVKIIEKLVGAFALNENFQIKYKNSTIAINNCHDQLQSYIFVTFEKDKGIEKVIENYQKADFSIIRLVDMLKGIHHLNSYTFEKFIPQNLNMSAEMGINFKKGCYIGQEIIARTHYLGKVKKNIAIIESDGVFKNSDKINNQDNEIVGEVIDDIFSTHKKIRLYMIMIREVNRSDSIYINKYQVQLINI